MNNLTKTVILQNVVTYWLLASSSDVELALEAASCPLQTETYLFAAVALRAEQIHVEGCWAVSRPFCFDYDRRVEKHVFEIKNRTKPD